MNVEIKCSWDTVKTEPTKIYIRFTGKITLNSTAEQIAEGIRGFLRRCEMECDFLSHREPKEVQSESPNATSSYTDGRGEYLILQWTCTPMQSFYDQNDRDTYINQVLEVRGYVPW